MSTTAPTKELGQGLLKRHEGMSIDDFRKHYTERHALIAIPWFLANGVSYYAQHKLHRPLSWTSETAASKNAEKIPNLTDWDAGVELKFLPGHSLETMTKGQSYYQEVIIPDERNLFLTVALENMESVDAETVKGERVEFIVDGKAVVDSSEWRSVWAKYEGRV
ncbi:hypothetical protein LTR78_007962 [Recurvomyces mirabilis]|uniref:EthD domain-containing protein n=1 Tax=Recurvomyces mirabilis TaxID=574656 RepID=A0AAE0WFX4_9PEZI|nr:hypothetical protein LTR78_007962 [Recurvomyces mirabilis]KAK5152498.1 hypothetical protein LTS14_008445 [Recurvomyces mirabilis]